ncbi:mitochondrial potassium channel isoform X2 [Nilaparvata lugens]|uniref:mitochondrial potassium channel isoform X2 n=1 Tax=Nilaparvata lugens TaxID=108931 RepID=UPI00193CCEF1|nr:mitochondrial potassium channel isoform X2 [Nilaparvata lugens]
MRHFLKIMLWLQSTSLKIVRDSRSLAKAVKSHNLPLSFREYCKEDHSVSGQGTSMKINEGKNYLKNKIDDLVVWYEQVTGLDEVRFVQNRVIEAQDRLVVAQNKRRESSKALSVVQNKLKDIYAELDNTTRGEERYLQLITHEHAVLKEERLLTEEFNQNEREERDCFTFLSSAVKESHEKERAQAEKTKYWSVIGSILGTMIGVLGSSINNQFKMKELRKMANTVSREGSHILAAGWMPSPTTTLLAKTWLKQCPVT